MENNKKAQILCYYLTFIAMGLSAGLLGPTLFGLTKQTGSTFAQIGFVFTVHSLGYVVGSTIFGRLYDKIAGHKILSVMIVFLSIALILISLSTTLWFLLLAALILGTAEGVGQVGVNTLLIWLFGEKSTPYLNGAHFCFGVGALTSPLIVAQLLENGYGFNKAYILVALLILPAIIVFLLVPSPDFKRTETVENTKPVKYGFIILVALFYFLYLGIEISFGGWISTFATTLEISNEAKSAYLASAFWAALTFGRLIAIPISVKLKPRFIITADLVLALIGYVVIAYGGDSFTNTLIGTIIIGASFASIYPTMFSLAGNRFNITGRIAGFFVMGGSLGSMIFPFSVGLAFETSGPRSLIVFNIVMIFIAFGVLFAILASFPKKQLKPTS